MKLIHKSALLAATVLSMSYALPAYAQGTGSEDAESNGDIIVTAQRTEQRLQDVPISITVFSQEKLDNNNILSAKDIATYTPGVYAQTRFGNDTTTYTIRGFAQEQRTTATVGTYFAEVVAPRGNGVSQGGDGASPGALFDLQNVQVLKGPQGTLFGRNTTGGAVLLVPVKPKDSFEGYIEGTAGALNRWRIQGVLNVPLSDTLRVRLGIDRHKRDGYIKNIGIKPLHDDDFGSIDILALRGSVVWDITPDIENYLIATYSKSQSSGATPLIKCITRTITATGLTSACNDTTSPGLANKNFTGLASAQVAREQATGDFWTGTGSNPFGEAFFEELRIINRTEFKISDSISLINLFGYSEIKGNNAVDAFGLNSPLVATPTVQNDYFSFVPINANPDFGLTANQRAVVEELRLTGTSDRFNWQAGFYFEKSSPKDFTGTMSPTAQRCTNINLFQCNSTAGGTSSATISANKVWNESIAVFAQGTYELSDKFSVTAGLRWTQDKTRAEYINGRVFFNPANNWANNTFGCGFVGFTNPATGQPIPIEGSQTFPNTRENRTSRCLLTASTKTSAPTWTINLEYKPTSDVLAYAKWSRGYRQGSVVPPAPPLLEAYDKESVDLFEIGAKTSWRGSVPGRFNIAAYYNDFRGQQIQAGINNAALTIQTTAIINAKSSETYGIEADLQIEPADWVKLEAAYSYNHTRLKDIAFPDLSSLGLIVRPLQLNSPIPLSVPHAFNGTVTFTLPVPESVGKISLSGTIVHMSSFRAVADAPGAVNTGILPKRTFGNININWKDVGGMPIDAAFYITNVTNEKMFTHINDQSNNGFISYSVDEPRQWGVRLKYRFGGLAD
ncbi:MAG: TonB-dependent receptor [Novosphingobium sp.]